MAYTNDFDADDNALVICVICVMSDEINNKSNLRSNPNLYCQFYRYKKGTPVIGYKKAEIGTERVHFLQQHAFLIKNVQKLFQSNIPMCNSFSPQCRFDKRKTNFKLNLGTKNSVSFSVPIAYTVYLTYWLSQRSTSMRLQYILKIILLCSQTSWSNDSLDRTLDHFNGLTQDQCSKLQVHLIQVLKAKGNKTSALTSPVKLIHYIINYEKLIVVIITM